MANNATEAMSQRREVESGRISTDMRDSDKSVAKSADDLREISTMDSPATLSLTKKPTSQTSSFVSYDPNSSVAERRIVSQTTTTITTTKTERENLVADTLLPKNCDTSTNSNRAAVGSIALNPQTTRPQHENSADKIARVEHLGRKADTCDYAGPPSSRQSHRLPIDAPVSSSTRSLNESEDFSTAVTTTTTNKRLVDKRVTTIGTIAAQSVGQSRIVVALLRDGEKLELKVQEMRPGVFEVGANATECARCCDEHRKLMQNLHKHRQAPMELWLSKYKNIRSNQPAMSEELRSIYLCMGDNLQACWSTLWRQLELKAQLLEETYRFYELVQNMNKTIESAEQHVQIYRKEFLDGRTTLKFNQASKELRQLNDLIAIQYKEAKQRQQSLVALIGRLATSNLDDARQNYLISDAQNLINHIANYLMPLERRKIQLESVTTTVSNTTNTTTFDTLTRNESSFGSNRSINKQPLQQTRVFDAKTNGAQTGRSSLGMIREVSNFNDLNLVDSWLNSKIEQLNSSLLSSLGVSVNDSRSILAKHEQIALECSAIEEATLQFNGKNIHALKSGTNVDEKNSSLDRLTNKDNKSLFEAQKTSANKVRDVITILSARIVLLRRTIDFYTRAKDASEDISKMMRRLQVDNSLQSVQYVANELELKDVSSVIASGATIISELQQLQLAQKHGQRPSIVGLNLITNGIRAIIDQLSQDLSHLKTVLNQRRLILLNEDAAKKATNFTTKCQQLKTWLNSQAKSYLLSNNRVGTNLNQVRAYCDGHEKLRCALQNKTLEVEALLRLLSTLMESFDAKSQTADEIQRETDELRQDWINVTNCLDKRLELAKKYMAVLTTVSLLEKELNSLDDLYSGDSSGTRPKTPERTDDDIKSNIDQSWLQLSNLVRNFALDAQKSNTALVYPQALNANPVIDDINKQELVDDANQWLAKVEDRKKKGPTTTRERKRRADTTAQANNINNISSSSPDAPQFIKGLTSKEIEPFHTVVLECETDPSRNCRVEWFMNNFKRIPSNIRHSITSQGNKHKLTINSFNSVCCGRYLARASNEAGQAVTQCRLRLSGIKEVRDDDDEDNIKLIDDTEDSVQSAPNANTGKEPAEKSIQRNQYNENSMRRIIQSVGQQRGSESPAIVGGSSGTRLNSQSTQATIGRQPESGLQTRSSTSKTSQFITTSDSESNVTSARTPSAAPSVNLSVVESRYSGGRNNWIESTTTNSTTTTKTDHLRVPSQGGYYVESPSSSTTFSKSTSQSPLVGPPQSVDCSQRCGSRGSNLMCVVIGAPPPPIEWLHNEVPIAKTMGQKPAQSGNGLIRGNICKLTIETSTENNTGGPV